MKMLLMVLAVVGLLCIPVSLKEARSENEKPTKIEKCEGEEAPEGYVKEDQYVDANKCDSGIVIVYKKIAEIAPENEVKEEQNSSTSVKDTDSEKAQN